MISNWALDLFILFDKNRFGNCGVKQMIEVKGPDGKVFKFPMGTPQDIISATLEANYGNQSATPNIESAQNNAPPIEPTNSASHDNYSTNDYAPRNSAIKASSIAAIAALAALALFIGLWAGGVFKKSQSQTQTVENSAYQNLSVNDQRQATVATQIRAEAKSDAAILKELASGAVVEVVGEQAQNGANWAKVRLDNSSSATGWVNASHFAPLGIGAGAVNVVGGTLPNTGVVGAAPVGVVQSPPVQIPPTNYYVASKEINVRTAANPNAQVIAKLALNTPLVATQTQNYSGRDWIFVRTNSGVSGWVNSNIVSQTPVVQQAIVNTAPMATAPTRRFSEDNSNGQFIVTALNANVRSSPTAKGGPDGVIDVMSNGDVFVPLDVRVSEGYPWYLVVTDKGIRGWVSSKTVAPY